MKRSRPTARSLALVHSSPSAHDVNRHLLDTVEEVVFTLAYPELTISYCNSPADHFFRITSGVDTAVGRPLLDMVRPHNRPIWQTQIEKAVAQGRSDTDYVDSYLGRIWQVGFRRLPYDGPCTAISVTCRDITDVTKTQQRLAKSEALYRTLFQSMGIGAVIQDRNGRIIAANSAAAEIVGRSEQDMLGMSSGSAEWDAIYPDGTPIPSNNRPAVRTLSEGRPQKDVLFGLRRPSGERRWVRITHQPLVTAGDGTIDAIVTTFYDVTEKRALEERTVAQMRQLDRALEQSLTAMAEMIEMRDPYTAGHQRKVADMAHAIATEMGLDEQRCHLIRQAAMVHDIGKNAVPVEILVKPTRLSALELEVVKQHVDYGYRILSSIDFAEPVAEIVRQHHERLDGTGYPRGLAGDEIWLESRIITVADVADAMSSHRPYRPSLGMDAALAELEQNAGRYYDAAVVAAFKRTLDRA
jgi:PAS domain S-box-containing protein/putative nucleotidyltransferase with HDIG domain